MTDVTCRLTAKNRDQLRKSTLSNRVWATFFYLSHARCANALSYVMTLNCSVGRAAAAAAAAAQANWAMRHFRCDQPLRV